VAHQCQRRSADEDRLAVACARIAYCNSGIEDRAEAIVEGIPLFYRDGLGKATGGDRELVEETYAAEKHEAIAVPVLHEADLRLPLVVFAELSVAPM
jgi:hypothetical protein